MSDVRIVSPEKWVYVESASLPFTAAQMTAQLGGPADYAIVIGSLGGSHELVVKNLAGAEATFPGSPNRWTFIGQMSEVTSTDTTGVVIGRADWSTKP